MALEGQTDGETARLFGEFLAAAEEGRDVSGELLLQAGAARDALRARILLHNKLAQLAVTLDQSHDRPLELRKLGRFEILGFLGKGGSGRVFVARDPKLERKIALKILEREALLERSARTWILNEARALARLEHPGVVKIHEVGEADTHTFIAMELLSGHSLEDLIVDWRRARAGESPKNDEVRALASRYAPYSARLALLARIAEALAYCHDHGVLHRDIKPQNVHFDLHGNAKLIDFGLAHDDGAGADSRLGLTESLVGTAAYIAPEQVASDRTGADPRSDQFAFGTLAYSCLALENPFQRKTRRASLDAVEEALPPPLARKAPGLPPDAARVVHHALARDPGDRYPSLEALASDLHAVIDSRPVLAVEPSIAHLGRLWLRRHRRAVAVAAGAVLVASIMAVLIWVTGSLRFRGAVREELGAIRPEEFRGPEDLDRTFQPLLDLKRKTAEFDGGLLRATLWGKLAGETEEVLHQWSRALRACQDRALQESATQDLPIQDLIFHRLLWEDAVLCPDCPYNKESRLRGHVRLPWARMEGHEFSFAMLRPIHLPPPESASAFRQTALTELLVPGTYRLQLWKHGGTTLAMEAVFFVPEGWFEERVVEVNLPRDELAHGALPVPQGTVTLQHGERFDVPAFRIIDHLVTVAEFDSFLQATHYKPLEFRLSGESLEATDPAWVDYDSAMAYASWAGGHLPSRFETLRAFESDAIATPEPTYWASGEFLLDMSSEHDLNPAWLEYADIKGSRVAVVLRGQRITSRIHPEDARRTPVGFRICFAADKPEAYCQLAKQTLAPVVTK